MFKKTDGITIWFVVLIAAIGFSFLVKSMDPERGYLVVPILLCFGAAAAILCNSSYHNGKGFPLEIEDLEIGRVYRILFEQVYPEGVVSVVKETGSEEFRTCFFKENRLPTEGTLFSVFKNKDGTLERRRVY